MDIPYQDDALLAVNKPAGLLIHPSPLSADRQTLTSRLAEEFRGDPRGIPRPVHRIDRPASGLVLAAFPGPAAAALSRAFREHQIQKEYLAITRGWPGTPGTSFTVDIPLARKNPAGRTPASVPSNRPGPQPAHTRFTVLARAEYPFPDRRHPATRLALLLAQPQTGRYHQIRRHLARTGYPIAGDTSHGDTAFNRCLARGRGKPLRLALHASALRLNHPDTGTPLTLQAPLPADLAPLLQRLLANIPPQQRETLDSPLPTRYP